MLWNLFKQLFWCGVVHNTKVCMDLSEPDVEPTQDDVGQVCVCSVCGTTYDVE